MKDTKRVTFDPSVQETQSDTVNGDAAEISKKPVTLKEAADIVVRCLDPFYKKGKFATKVIFLNCWVARLLWITMLTTNVKQIIMLTYKIIIV